MTPSILLTGATGYVGGSVLDSIYQKFPEAPITVLLRGENVKLSERYPKLKIEYGSFSDLDLLEKLAASHDIIIRCGYTDDLPSAKALLKGSISTDRAHYFIHLTGTGAIADHKSFPGGELNSKVWSDVDDIKAIQSLPQDALHQHVDQYIRDFAIEHGDKVKVAVISPPDIYGEGTGVGKQDSYLVPLLVREVLKRGRSFYLGNGENIRSVVHIRDVVQLFALVIEDAINGGNKVGWGKDAYFFAATQEISGKDLSKAVGEVLYRKEILKDPEPQPLPLKEGISMIPDIPIDGTGMALYLFAANSRSRSDRAAKQLGYVSRSPSFWEQLERDVEIALTSQYN